MPDKIAEIEEYREKARDQVIEIIKKIEEMLDEKYSGLKIKQLKKEGYKFEYQIIPRIKSTKSILRKFDKHQDKNLDLTTIGDLIGIRIIVPTTKDMRLYISPLNDFLSESTALCHMRYLKDNKLEKSYSYPSDDQSCVYQKIFTFNGFNVEIQLTTPEMAEWMDNTHDEYVLRVYGEEYKEDTGLGR